MSRTRSIALIVITVGVTLGSGLVAENRDAIEARLGGETAPGMAPGTIGGTPFEASGRVPGSPPVILAAGSVPVLPFPAPGSRVAGLRPAEGANLWARVVGAPGARRADGRGPSLARLTDVQPVAFAMDGLAMPGAFAAAVAVPTGVEAPAEACPFRVEATPAPAATVDLSVWAPCAAGEALTVTHEGMALRVALDGEGRASLAVPALATPAAFALAAKGAAAVASAEVPDLALFDRVVLQWRGPVGLELRARAFGVAHGAQGDVRADAPGDLAGVMSGASGLLVALGDPDLASPLMAQVYTFPPRASLQGRAVALTVEAQVSEATCGRTLAAQVIQLSPGAAPFASAVDLPLPGCDALGEWVALDEAVLDLTAAAL